MTQVDALCMFSELNSLPVEISIISFLGVPLTGWECHHFISIAKISIHWGSRIKMCGADRALSWVNFRFNQFLSLCLKPPWGCQVVIVFHLAILSYQGQIQKKEKVGFIQGQRYFCQVSVKKDAVARRTTSVLFGNLGQDCCINQIRGVFFFWQNASGFPK